MPLKPIDKNKNPGLAKLPTGVRNKMGYMKKGGAVKKKDGGMVLEIGLRPATEKEMKMAKEMESQRKKLTVEWYPEELELRLAEKVLKEYFNG
jgi:hypothetical protein